MQTCPHCNVSLEETDYQGILIDKCPSCGGMLFDNHELLETIENNIQTLDNGNPAFVEHKRISLNKKSAVNCPSCHKPMRQFNYGYGEDDRYHDTDIIINSCLDCKKVWLDQGELNAVFLARGGEVQLKKHGEMHPIAEVKPQAGKTHLCPNCKDVELKSITKKGLEVDYCPKCAGIWFDNSELTQFLDKQIKEKLNQDKPETEKLDEEKRICPKCHIPLTKHRYNLSSTAQVDSCIQCGGVWLDRGEFNQIKDRLGSHVKQIDQLNHLGTLSLDIVK